MAELYRKSALERLSSPEQLDKALKVTSPLSWLALIALTLIVAVVVVWSIYGTIPVTVTVSGVLVETGEGTQTGTAYVFMDEPCREETDFQALKRAGAEVSYGEVLAEYYDSLGAKHQLLSHVSGIVVEVAGANATTTSEPVFRIKPNVSPHKDDPSYYPSHVAVLYVSLSDSQKLVRGEMDVYVEPEAFDTQKYGHMRARIINVDRDVYSTVHEKRQFEGVAVTCELYPAQESENGFWWSNSKGMRLELDSDTYFVNARIAIEEIHPYQKLFTKLKEIWEG